MITAANGLTASSYDGRVMGAPALVGGTATPNTAWRTNIAGGVSTIPILEGQAMHANAGTDFPLVGGISTPVPRYAGTAGRTGPGRNDFGQFSPKYSGAGGVPGEVVDPNYRTTKTMGFMANQRVHYQHVVNPTALPYDTQIFRQMYVFHKRGTGGPIDAMFDSAYANMGEAWNHSVFPTFLPLPIVNWMLASSAIVGEEEMTPEDVLQEFTAKGVVYSTMGVVGMDNNPRAIIGFSLAGPEEVFNYWGGHIRSETFLYFIIKKVERPNYYVLNPTAQSVDRPLVPEGRTLKRRCFQILPWANCEKQQPTTEDVMYTDDDGNTRYGIAICVGRVQFTNAATSMEADPFGKEQLAPYSVPAVISNATISMFCTTPEILRF